MSAGTKAQQAFQREAIRNRLTAWWQGDEPLSARPNGVGAGGPNGAAVTPEPDGYVVLKQRLMTWWNGDEAGDLATTDNPSLRIEESGQSESDQAEWSDDRVRLSKILWGEGYIRPNTEVFANELMSGLRLDPRKTILDVAPGLGATALIMVKEKSVWIEAIESDPDLMRHAKQRLALEKCGHHINIRHEDFTSFELPPLRYHIIYGREHLYSFASKDHILRQLCRSLKDHGKLLLFDYVVKEGSYNSPAIEAWREIEPTNVYPWTVGEYRRAFESGGLSLHGREDFTDTMIHEIRTAWHRMLQNLETGGFKPGNVDRMMKEGRLWQSRLRALESGDLKLLRLDARKTAVKPALEGDDPAD